MTRTCVSATNIRLGVIHRKRKITQQSPTFVVIHGQAFFFRRACEHEAEIRFRPSRPSFDHIGHIDADYGAQRALRQATLVEVSRNGIWRLRYMYLRYAVPI